MQRCRECNSSLRPEELACYACGSAVVSKDTKSVLGRRFVTVITIAFFISAGMTILSLFIANTPPFLKCLTSTVVLMFVRSSAGQMLEKKEG